MNGKPPFGRLRPSNATCFSLQPFGHPTAGASLSQNEKIGLPTLLRHSKRTPALKQATRSVSKSCYAVGFTLR
ncbi:MAG: hypothetical protein V7L29_31605 [Nostoc sp.]|uniref:hypothetical protein n=1 Tax=Nostoc sp. TaxID=1180 RepID=UPI002FF64D78